jgi:hypothetical protein
MYIYYKNNLFLYSVFSVFLSGVQNFINYVFLFILKLNIEQ